MEIKHVAAVCSGEGAEELSHFVFGEAARGFEVRAADEVVVYTEANDPAIEGWRERAERIGLMFSLSPHTERNWVAQCEEIWKPVDAGRFKIVPWFAGLAEIPPREASNGERIELRIIPGTGFGTGHHESTVLALELLQAIHSDVFSSAPSAGVRVLDLGTGSGILAIGAALLREGGRIVGVDNDPFATSNARENVELNRCPEVSIVDGTIEDVEGEFDILFANIYAEVLVDLETELRSRVRPGGVAILSGITEEKLSLVTASYGPPSWSLGESRTRNGWSAALLLRV